MQVQPPSNATRAVAARVDRIRTVAMMDEQKNQVSAGEAAMSSAMSSAVSFAVNPLSETGAAEIVGLDCSAALDPQTLAALKRAMLDHPVVAIRGQTLTPRQQAAFSRQLGPLETQDRKIYCHPEDPDI